MIPGVESWEGNIPNEPGTSHHTPDSEKAIRDSRVTSIGRWPALPWVVLKYTAAGHIRSHLEEPPTNQRWDNIIQ